MSNIKVIEILLGVLLTLMIFQIYFKSFKTVSDKQILFVLIIVLLCDKLFNKSKKEHNTGDLAPVTVDGAAAVFDAEAFDNLNKVVKALAGEGTITIPGNVIIEGTLEIRGANLKFDKKDDGTSIIATTQGSLKIQRLDSENNEQSLSVFLSTAGAGSSFKSTNIHAIKKLQCDHETFVLYLKVDELKRWNNSNNVINLKHKLMQSEYVWDRRSGDNRPVLKRINQYGSNYANDPPGVMGT